VLAPSVVVCQVLPVRRLHRRLVRQVLARLARRPRHPHQAVRHLRLARQAVLVRRLRRPAVQAVHRRLVHPAAVRRRPLEVPVKAGAML